MKPESARFSSAGRRTASRVHAASRSSSSNSPTRPRKARDGGLIEQIADGVRHSTLDGITDVVHDSDQNGMRLVVELAPSIDPDAIVDTLHAQTDLQISCPVRMVAHLEGTPRRLTLRDLIAEWVASPLLGPATT